VSAAYARTIGERQTAKKLFRKVTRAMRRSDLSTGSDTPVPPSCPEIALRRPRASPNALRYWAFHSRGTSIADTLRSAASVARRFRASHAEQARSRCASARMDFGQLDANNDGMIDQTEANKSAPLRSQFRSMDKDGDGKISRSEWSSHFAQFGGSSAASGSSAPGSTAGSRSSGTESTTR
jgi:hypothetical protein